MAPSSASFIGSKQFPVDGMNDEICATTTWDDLSRFLWNEDLITPITFGFGADFLVDQGAW